MSIKNGHARDTTWWKWWKKQKRPTSGSGKNGRSAFGAVLRPFKDVVSTQSTRFMEDGFDLDVAYVTKRIIVHGVPNVSADPLYADPRTEIRRLLDKYHCGRYKVYNFASELAQMTPPTHVVDTKVESYPFTDDTCPPLESVVDFCENAKAWLDAHEDNVVSLHCKAGKGRAGIMAACLMVRMGETAHTAVASFDATQGADIRRTGMNHRAWVFLYERLIREVWGLRETIGTVSGQNPSLRAPPRLATGIRDVSLQLQVPPRRSRWKQILHHPSCAVYQQTPGGKALVHRARMPSVSPRKRDQKVSVFTATLPRSVVVEGTFQVVVSAATGLFGVGKNVLDVWCNTTFLGEDGGRELFTFTENDLPPGPLAKRLLAAKVSVLLTHASPDAPSPDRRHVNTINWDGIDLHDEAEERDSTAANSALALIGPVEHSTTPETDPEEASDESMYDNVVVNGHTATTTTTINNNSNNHNGAVSINGGGGAHKSPAGGAAANLSDDEDDGRFYLSSDDDSTGGTPTRNGMLQVAGGIEPIHVIPSTSPWNIQGAHGNFGSSSGYTTPMSSRCPSPIRSCPRSTISAKRERLNDRTPRRDESAGQEAATAAPSGLPRWASSKTLGPAPARKGALPPAVGASEQRQKQQEEGRPRATTPLGALERNSLAWTPPRKENGVAGARGAGTGAQDSSSIGGARKPWTMVAPDPTRANGASLRPDTLVLSEVSQVNGWSDGDGKDGQAGEVIEVTVTSADSTSSSGFKGPSPAVKLLLEAAAARSFEDLQSSRHTSAFGSETGDGDGEKASLAAHVPAGRTGGEASAAEPFRDTENRVRIATEARASTLDGARVFDSEGLEPSQPLKQRVWPPSRGVVAGVEEVQGALESPSGDDAQLARRHGRHGSTGMSWGEDAKLALARKRLQWEKSRRGASEGGSESLRLHAALVAKREAELLAIETDVKQAVRILEERIARRESAEAALKKWRRQLPSKAYNDVMSCLSGNQAFGLYGSD